MRPVIIIISLFLALHGLSQQVKFFKNFKVDDPMRIKNFEIIHADNSGAYTIETRYKVMNISYSAAIVQTLYKTNTNGEIIYQKTISDLLGDDAFKQFIVLDDQLYAFSNIYDGYNWKIGAARLSLADGSVTMLYTRLFSIEQPWGDGYVTFEVKLNYDSSGFIIGVNHINKTLSRFLVRGMDKNLFINNQFAINYGEGSSVAGVEAFFVEKDGILLSIRNYNDLPGKKKKIFFKNIAIRSYTFDGKLNYETIPKTEGRILSSKVFKASSDKLMVVDFFSKDSTELITDGLSVNTININDGKIVNTGNKEINNQVLGYAVAGDKDANKGVKSVYVIRDIIPNPVTHGISIITEASNGFGIEGVGYIAESPVIGRNKTQMFPAYDLLLGDLLICDINPANGELNWLSSLSKKQVDKTVCVTAEPSESEVDYEMTNRFSYNNLRNMPPYCSVGVFPSAKGLHFIFNDHEDNSNVVGIVKKVKKMETTQSSVVYDVVMDYSIGKFKRYTIPDVENSKFALQPKYGLKYKNLFYVPYVQKNKDFYISKIIFSEE